LNPANQQCANGNAGVCADIDIICCVALGKTLNRREGYAESRNFCLWFYKFIVLKKSFIVSVELNFYERMVGVKYVAFVRQFYILRSFANLRSASVSIIMSVRPFARPPEWNNSAPTGRIFMKFYTGIFFENPHRKFKFYYNRAIMTVLYINTDLHL
jgi:hypothetical protein